MNPFLLNARDLNPQPGHEVLIRFPDCDPFGHLNNAKYLTYFVNAREGHVRDYYGFDTYVHAQKTGRSWVVRSANVAFAVPALNNERVRISTQLIGLTANQVRIEGVMEGTRGIHSVSWVDLTYVDTATGRPVKHEADLQELFDNLLVPVQEDQDLEVRLRALRRSRKNHEQRELAAH